MQVRLNKFISSNSEYSRRKADELINQGHISINGKINTEMGTVIDSSKDVIKINGKTISEKIEQNIYLALNKPQNYITTRNDEFGRQTIMELLPKNKNLKPVGRLDKNSEGLILISNDGEFINRYTHPKFECEKEYFAVIEGQIKEAEINKLTRGVIIDEYKTAPAKIKIIKIQPKETILKITIQEGRNRQIRKMFALVKHPVKYLQRVRIGTIFLQDLRIGKYRNLTPEEINAN